MYVYLLDSAGKGCSLQFFKFVVLFSRIMFLKSDLFYFVLVAKAYGFCLRARPVNSDHILNVLETVKFVFCLQIHALAECTMIAQCRLISPCILKIFSNIAQYRQISHIIAATLGPRVCLIW